MAQVEGFDKWHLEQDAALAAAALLARVRRGEEEQSPRVARAWRYASLFEGLGLSERLPSATDARSSRHSPELESPVIRNRARSVIMTWVSKVSANDSPLPQFMTSDGDWDSRRKAVAWDRAVEAEIGRPTGAFSDAHALWRHVTLMAAVIGSAGVYFGLDADGEPCSEFVDSLTTYPDAVEPTAAPHAIAWKRRLPLHVAQQMWPKRREQLKLNEEVKQDTTESFLYGRDAKRAFVEIYCGWSLGHDEQPGRYLAVLSDGTVLADEDYVRPELPFVFYHFERELFGQWGVPLMQSLYWSTLRENEIMNDCHASERSTPQVVIMAHPSQVAPDALSTSRAVHIVELTQEGLARPPAFATIPKYNAQSIELAKLEASQAYELSGVSQAHSGALRSQGTTSGRHESLVAALFTERFADHERRLLTARTVSTARQLVWRIQDAIDGGVEYSRKSKKGRVVDAAQLDFELDFEITIKPVSEDKSSPAARAKELKEYFDAQLISGAEYIGGMQHLDSIAVSKLATQQEQWIDEQVEVWLYEDDPAPLYESPVKWIDPAAAARQVALAFLRARSEKAPPERLEFFETFMAECQIYIDQEKLAAAASSSPSAVGPEGLSAAFPGAGMAGAIEPAPTGAIGGLAQ